MVGAFCVGGGYASIPLIQTQVIDVHHWISFSEFMDVVAISQMTPGPIGINAATFVGTKVAGIGGAVAATAGFVTPSLIIMIALAKLLAKYGDMGAIRGVLNGLRPAVVALIASAGVMFLTLSLWNEEKLPAVWSDPDLVSTIVLLVFTGPDQEEDLRRDPNTGWFGVIEFGAAFFYKIIWLKSN